MNLEATVDCFRRSVRAGSDCSCLASAASAGGEVRLWVMSSQRGVMQRRGEERDEREKVRFNMR